MAKSSNRLGQYDDVRVILDAAIAAHGGEVELPTHGEAVHWRQRAYAFRKMYAEHISAASPYDKLTLPRLTPASNIVVIKVSHQPAVFRPKVKPTAPADDELLNYAESLAKDIGI